VVWTITAEVRKRFVEAYDELGAFESLIVFNELLAYFSLDVSSVGLRFVTESRI